MFDDVIVKVLDTWGAQIVQDMKLELQLNGSLASDALYNSLSYNVKSELDEFILSFDMESYGKYVESGRKSGKYPPLSNIQKWTRLKGIPESAAFPIARKIFKFGIQPRPFIRPSIDKNRRGLISDLVKYISSETYNVVRSEIVLGLKKGIK